MNSAFLQVLLWVAPHVCLAVVLYSLLSRRAYQKLPFFFAYTLFTLIHFLLIFGIYLFWLFVHPGQTSNLYYETLIIGSGLGTILQFCVLYELASQLVFSLSKLAAIFRRLAQSIAAVLLLVAAVASAFIGGPGIHRLLKAFQTLDFSASLISTGLLLALFLFTSFLSISWQSLPAGVALGFGVWSSAEMAASALLSALGKSGYLTIDVIRIISFLVCTIIWLIYAIRPEHRPKFKGRSIPLPELEALDQEMQRMMQP